MDINTILSVDDIDRVKDESGKELPDIIEKLDYLADSVSFIEDSDIILSYIRGSLTSDNPKNWDTLINIIDEYMNGSISAEDFVDVFTVLEENIKINLHHKAAAEEAELYAIKQKLLSLYSELSKLLK